jgi:hypothetical protein
MSGKSSSPLACGLIALGISGMLGGLSFGVVAHEHSRSNKYGNFGCQRFLVATGQGYRREVRAREYNVSSFG